MAVVSVYRLLKDNFVEFVAVGLITFVFILLLKLVIRIVNLRRAFKGFPEPGGKHWLLGHMKFVSISFVCLSVLLNLSVSHSLSLSLVSFPEAPTSTH